MPKYRITVGSLLYPVQLYLQDLCIYHILAAQLQYSPIKKDLKKPIEILISKNSPRRISDNYISLLSSLLTLLVALGTYQVINVHPRKILFAVAQSASKSPFVHWN